MAVNINTFKSFVEFVANKQQVGNTVTPAQFNLVAHQAQMQIFEKDRAVFITKQEVSDFLGLFLKNKTVTVPVNGTLPYPSDYEHTSSVRSYYVRPGGRSVEILVQPVKNRDWGEISSSQLQEPNKRFPKYSEFKTEFRFLPMDIGIVMLDYFRTPAPPVWAYTIVNGRPVYDPTNSVNFEWDEFAMNNVAANYLALIGVNLKDVNLSNFASQFQQKTNSVV